MSDIEYPDEMQPDKSDLPARKARVTALAIEAMGTEDGLGWQHEPNPSLGLRIPLEMLQTEVGSRQVEDVLLRIQHSVYR